MMKNYGNCLSKFYFSRRTTLLTHHSAAIYTSSCSKGKFNPSDFVPKNVLEPYYTAWTQKSFGRPADRKPFPIELKEGKLYKWCCCGWSKTQPFCDGTHRNQLMRITMKPVFFQVEKDGKYWLCNCKQTKHRPFCDGSHKCEEVQEKLKFM